MSEREADEVREILPQAPVPLYVPCSMSHALRARPDAASVRGATSV